MPAVSDSPEDVLQAIEKQKEATGKHIIRCISVRFVYFKSVNLLFIRILLLCQIYFILFMSGNVLYEV